MTSQKHVASLRRRYGGPSPERRVQEKQRLHGTDRRVIRHKDEHVSGLHDLALSVSGRPGQGAHLIGR